MAIGNTVRIAVGLLVVAAVVAVNQTDRRPARPSVLGTKVTRCTVEGLDGTTEVSTGVREIRAESLSVTVKGGKPGAALAPSARVTPGQSEAPGPVSIQLGVRGAASGRLDVTVVVRNTSSCPIAVRAVRVSARRSQSSVSEIPVTFGGRDRVVVQPRDRITGRAVLSAPTDGSWLVDATASADVGAAA